MFRRLGGAGLLWNVLAVLLAVFTYFYGLDNQHIHKNGDEYPYAHITRLTAASGQKNIPAPARKKASSFIV